ncbi:MAG TPA: OmpH family outer membrane protein [Smithella sp.]|jgi:outer membrane protein|nr:OmpH family outer membrane protein [Smithella sp.]NMC96956.1 OmpH family outer membrane protein [Deltaproteobacteria bacterium]HOO36174.1 OmpH family outer membrane protein [Smithella sp.]HPC08177.1 OmpH family outer membrane protein [Smithella sp.]HPK22677.1 OmpH family outer membrane protein [Smithella sp.]
MKKKDKRFVGSLAFVFALLFVISSAGAALADAVSAKIGFVDIAKIMRDSRAAQNARAVYQKDFESKKATLKAKGDRVSSLEKDLSNTKQDSPALKEKREKLAQEFKEFKRLESDLNEQLKKKDAELTRKILMDVQEILKQFSKNEKYSMIFEKKAALVVDDGFDVTDKIIKIYDAQKK